MQIKLTSKIIDSVSKTHIRVILIEKGTEHIVREKDVVVLEVCAGKLSKITPRTLRTLIRGIVQSAKKCKLEKIALELDYTQFSKCHEYGEEWFWSTISENITLADYEYTVYKSKTPVKILTEVLLVTSSEKIAKNGIAHGVTVATNTNICRDLANTPGGDMTPQILAEQTKKIFKGTKAKVSVLDEKAIKKLKMGGLLGVGQGAEAKPRFIIIEYKEGKKTDAPIVFVGKGITFDTGGLQVKPGMSMYEMHMDMSGGASVIASIAAITKLGLKKNVIGLIPAAENAIGDKAIRPGDVLTMMSGTTVDVLHTDAEGRLVLADALHYARRYNPKLVVDIATLTGASLVAVGQHAHVIMTKSRTLEDKFRELGEESGDYVFPLPLWSEYKQYLKGVHGDIANIPSGDSKYGGTITAGMFLSHFTKKMKWVHIDMAPRMTAVGSDKLTKGATGEPTRLLVKIAENF
ncbi:MAG: leucyl aminopeptidase [Minisyncoccia bacterium]